MKEKGGRVRDRDRERREERGERDGVGWGGHIEKEN